MRQTEDKNSGRNRGLKEDSADVIQGTSASPSDGVPYRTSGSGGGDQKEAVRSLVILCTAAFLVPFMGSALNLALPQISSEFSLNAVTLTWLTTVYLISTGIFQIPFARVADIVGRKKIFLIGLSLFCICTLLCAFANSGEMLLALRFLSGIGSAMMFGTNIAIITSLFPPQKRGWALGINAAVVYAALAAGPFLGGFLTDYLGWQSIFVFSAGIGLAVMILARIFLKGEWIESRGESFDWWGSILYGIGLAGIIYGFTSLPHTRGFVCLAIGALAFIFFARFELKHKFPVFDLRLFTTNRVFTLSSLAALINYAATSAVAFMLSLYLQYIREFDASSAGLILICQASVQSLFSLLSGRFSRRIAPSSLATTGMIIIVFGLIGMAFLGFDTPLWMIISYMILLGIGFGIFSAPNTNVIMSSVSPASYTAASAATGTMRLTGQAFSMGIAGMAISFNVGQSMITQESYGNFLLSLRTTFIIFAALCLAGVFASSARAKNEPKD